MSNPILSLPCEFIFCWSNGLKKDGTIDKQFEGIKQKWNKERATTEMEKEAYQGTTVISVLRNIPLPEGMICVDIDEPCTLEEVYEAYPVLRDTLYTTGNNKGWHFYFYNDHDQNLVDCLKTIKGDIITTQMFEREKEWFGKMRQLTNDDKETLLKQYPHFIEKWNKQARLDVRNFQLERAEFLDYLKFNLLKATEYQDWRNVGFALHHTFDESGLDLFHE
ncbi:MAG: PriCT-2 domain-containing protein, partial [Flavobacteriaceae bacterium]